MKLNLKIIKNIFLKNTRRMSVIYLLAIKYILLIRHSYKHSKSVVNVIILFIKSLNLDLTFITCFSFLTVISCFPYTNKVLLSFQDLFYNFSSNVEICFPTNLFWHVRKFIYKNFFHITKLYKYLYNKINVTEILKRNLFLN